MFCSAGWTRRGFPDPVLPADLERLLRDPEVGERGGGWLGEADKVLDALPNSPADAGAVPQDLRLLLLASARAYELLASPSGEGRGIDIGRMRYGMVRALRALGMWAAKRRLEDELLRTELPERFAQLLLEREVFQDEHGAFIGDVERAILSQLEAATLSADIVTVWCSLDGAWRRLQELRLPNFALARPTDFFDVYVMLEDEVECYRALRAVHLAGRTMTGGLRDLIAAPHENGFSALTTRLRVLRDPKTGVFTEPVNVIIQTREMNEIAWQGIADPSITEPDQRRFVKHLVERGAQRLCAQPTITVYGRGGLQLQATAYEMDAGSTILDLAYKIHAKLGHQAVSAVVNGEPANSLGRTLHEGDVVEIHRDRERKLARTEVDLALVITSYARTRINRALNKQGAVMRGRLAVLRALADRNVPIRGREELDDLVGAITLQLRGDLAERTANGVYRQVGTLLAIAEGQEPSLTSDGLPPTDLDQSITPGAVAVAISDRLMSVASGQLLRPDAQHDQWRPTLVTPLKGAPQFAKLCGHCHPNHESEILGLRLRDTITVHRPQCRYVRNRETLVMDWTRVEERVRSVIQLAGIDRPRLLVDICEQVHGLGATLQQIEARADHYGKATAKLHVYADSAASVVDLARALDNVKGIGTVRRESTHVRASRAGHDSEQASRGTSRSDATELTLLVRPTGAPVRHDSIHVPYDAQRPCFKGQFFGREHESSDLIKRTRGDGAPFIFISGPRMIGKSSLAVRFCDGLDIGDRPHQLRVDLRSCRQSSSREVFKNIVADFRHKGFADSSVADRDDPRDTLEALIDACDRHLLLILDEFGGPTESAQHKTLGTELFDWIRTKMDAEYRRVTLMMAGPPEAERLFRRLSGEDLRRIETFPVGVLRSDAAREMLARPLEDQGMKVAAGAAEALAYQCGGHPYYLIKLLGKLAGRLDLNRRNWRVDRKDANSAVEDLLQEHELLRGWALEGWPGLASQLCLDTLVGASTKPDQYVSTGQIAQRLSLEIDETGSMLEHAYGYQVLERSPDDQTAYRLAFPLLWTWIRRGGLRRDFFQRTNPSARRCLLTMADPAHTGEWLSIERIVTGWEVEQAFDTLRELTREGFLQHELGSYRLASGALKRWIDELRPKVVAA